MTFLFAKTLAEKFNLNVRVAFLISSAYYMPGFMKIV